MQASEVKEQRERILAGKVAVITGAGSGVGKSMAELFARSGCSVVAVDVVPDRVKGVVDGIAASGLKATGMVSDLSLREEPDRMIDQALAAHGRVDILGNNAGIMDGARPVAETPDEIWEKVMAINLDAPFRASRKVIPHMVSQGGGVIINTASLAGVFGGVAGAAYTVSKHGLIGLTKSIAAHYGSKGVRCNSMVLGGVNTNIGIGSAQPNKAGFDHLMKAASLMPRIGEPGEIAELALFLASPRSSFLNGSCIVIDGGWSVL